MGLYSGILNKTEKISLIGLGYVGLPIAIAFAKKINVVGFDISKDRIKLFKNGIEPTREVGDDAVKNTSVEFTCDEAKLQEVRFHIIAVPTPVNEDHTPDLHPMQSASRTVGRNLVKGSIVVFESKVYPEVAKERIIANLEIHSEYNG